MSNKQEQPPAYPAPVHQDAGPYNASPNNTPSPGPYYQSPPPQNGYSNPNSNGYFSPSQPQYGPQGGYYQPGYQQGYPPQGYQQGYPPQGYQQGYPPQGYYAPNSNNRGVIIILGY
ncbi:hypothetical protein EYB25_003649 [Talaromyces marneffei]|uniref:uncharacterized protein n=1 Tax=Talaromyces marneffei TaxID=37727 RepID=UPI0012AA4FED|nr:uncharacterized protein EYB26_006121 [Talaromyces marneffei]KAE8555101.1 hypothetical protein EYB25_003649 [Talaromyces marneffei]QGA18436.1 hypothetical protein EYB26_006121 [Talaromyces marneffei]